MLGALLGTAVRLASPAGPRLLAGHADALQRSGLHVTRRDADGTSFSNGEGGEVRLRVDVQQAYRQPATEDHPEPQRIPGVTEITITVTALQPL